MKDTLDQKIMKAIVALRPKMYNYLTNDGHIDQEAEDTKKCVTKWEIKFEH